MVIRDLSDIEKPLPTSTAKSAPPISFVIDRFIALILDFLIFSPIVSLCVATLMRDVKTLLLLNSHSSEAFLIWGVLAVIAFSVTVLLQSLFLYFWQATPGQMFMQMRVVSYPQEQSRLNFSQCIQRAFLWTSSFFVGGLPFLEILSHPLRRAFYDRAADTMVVTLKKEADEGPLPLESRYIASWTRLFFLVMALGATTAFFKSYHSLRVLLVQTDKAVQTTSCEDERLEILKGDQRLDAAISLYLLNSINASCLGQEADTALWEDPHSNDSLAYLAKALTVADTAEQKSYQEKICTDESSETCLLSQVLMTKEGEEAPALKFSPGSLLTTQVMAMESSMENADFVTSLERLKELRKNVALTSALEKKYVRLIWSLQERQKSNRAPASAGEQELIQEFKDLYEVP